MKKILMAVCVISVLSLVGCKKDSNDPTPTPQEQGSEGIYNPGAKIATRTTDNGMEQWVWDGAKVDRIESADLDGNVTGVQQFTYNGDRIATATQTVEGIETEMRVNYSGNLVSSIGVYTDGTQSLNATVNHNAANKISSIHLDVDASYITNLLGSLMQGGGFNFVNAKGGRKLSLTSTDINATFEWQGDNVSRMIIVADIEAGVTMDDIAQVVDLNAMLGDMASLLALIQGEQPLTVHLRDTIDFTYDDQHNPLQGFIGLLDPQVLSANNYMLMDNHGIADINLTLNVPIMGPYPIEHSQPIVRVMDYYYTYNGAGFPLTVTDDEGNSTTYTYNE